MVEPSCRFGYTEDDLDQIIPDSKAFARWMNGQTRSICDGWQYNHDTQEYEPSACADAHGVVTYVWDVQRYLSGTGPHATWD